MAAVPVAAVHPGQADLGTSTAALQEASRQLDHLLLQHQLATMLLGSLTARGDKHPPRAPKMLHQCFSFKEPTRIVADGLADALDIIAGKNLSETLHRQGMGHVQKIMKKMVPLPLQSSELILEPLEVKEMNMSPLASCCGSMTNSVCYQAASWALWSSMMWPALRSCCHGCSSTSHPAGLPEFGHWNHCQLPITKRLTDRLKLHFQKVRGSTPVQYYAFIP